jgi:hypothetical protein
MFKVHTKILNISLQNRANKVVPTKQQNQDGQSDIWYIGSLVFPKNYIYTVFIFPPCAEGTKHLHFPTFASRSTHQLSVRLVKSVQMFTHTHTHIYIYIYTTRALATGLGSSLNRTILCLRCTCTTFRPSLLYVCVVLAHDMPASCCLPRDGYGNK